MTRNPTDNKFLNVLAAGITVTIVFLGFVYTASEIVGFDPFGPEAVAFVSLALAYIVGWMLVTLLTKRKLSVWEGIGNSLAAIVAAACAIWVGMISYGMWRDGSDRNGFLLALLALVFATLSGSSAWNAFQRLSKTQELTDEANHKHEN